MLSGGMSLEVLLERFGRGWRGPALAALVALLAGLPGLVALPPIDRDELRYAEASAQLLVESWRLRDARAVQDVPRYKKPVGIYWLQAASVATLSNGRGAADLGLIVFLKSAWGPCWRGWPPAPGARRRF